MAMMAHGRGSLPRHRQLTGGRAGVGLPDPDPTCSAGGRHPVRPLLVASGISSTVVGTLAGQVVMQGLRALHHSLWLRRVITMAPAFVVIAMGLNTTEILVLSQVILSFGIALALIPLLMLTGDRA